MKRRHSHLTLNLSPTFMVLWGGIGLLAFGDEAPETLDPVVVTAERPARNASRIPTPGNTTVLNQETIENSGSSSIADLLQNEAGIPFASFFGNPGFGSPILRGFAENASTRTLLLIDGLPANRSDLSAVPWFQLPLVDLERIELQRGSRTVRYGSAALGGVIALQTKHGEGDFSGSLESIFGSDDLSIHRGGFHIPLGEWDLSLQGEENQSDGYRQNSGHDSSSWAASLSSPTNSPFHGRWSLAFNELFFQNPGALSRNDFHADPTQSIYTRFGVADQYFSESESLRASQRLKWDLGSELEFSINASWFQRDRQTNFGAGNHSNNDLESWSLEPVLSGVRGDFTWEIGTRWQRDDLDLMRFTDLARTTALGDAELSRELYGAFALGSYELGQGWNLTGGVGWEHYRLKARATDAFFPDDSALNFTGNQEEDGFAAELSLEYESPDGWRGWLRYDRVYRFPVMDEIAAYQGFILSDPFNASLDPERGHALELGFSTSHNATTLDLTLYSQWLEDEIAYDYLANNNVNFSDTHRFGVETSIRTQGDSWEARLQHNFTIARYQNGAYEGNDVPLVPRNSLSGAVTWSPLEALALTLEGNYVSDSPEGNDFNNEFRPLPSRVVWNAMVRWEASEDLSLFIRANNILDHQYANLKYQSQWYPAAGRQISAGARWKF